MKLRTLYPWVLLCVLWALGCGAQEREEAVTPAPPPPEAADTLDASDDAATRVVIFGNSLTAGYGLDDLRLAFPALLQQKVDSLGWNVTIVNAGNSGETTAGGLSRIDWLLRQRIDVLILELGGNDGLRGLPTEVAKENLQGIIDKTRARYPEARIILAGMEAPTNMGAVYTRRFREIYPALARENDAALIPFLLEGVGGIAALNQADGIHPTPEGHRLIAEIVWQTLRPVLESMQVAA